MFNHKFDTILNIIYEFVKRCQIGLEQQKYHQYNKANYKVGMQNL